MPWPPWQAPEAPTLERRSQSAFDRSGRGEAEGRWSGDDSVIACGFDLRSLGRQRTRRRVSDVIRRTTAFLSGVFVLAACTTGGGASTAPSAAASQPAASQPAASAPASAAACTVGGVLEQLPTAALGEERPAEHQVDGRGSRRHVHRCRREPQQRAAADRHRHPDLEGRQRPDPARPGHEGSPAGLQKAKDAGIPVIAYDRLIEDPDILYITFDNVAVGKAEAEAIIAKVPEGNYVLIKGDPGDPNASTFLPQGWDDAGLKAEVDGGKITILNGPDGTFTDAWKTEKAQQNMEAIIDKAVSDGTKIDAILAENDSMALGVVAALTAKSSDIPR